MCLTIKMNQKTSISNTLKKFIKNISKEYYV